MESDGFAAAGAEQIYAEVVEKAGSLPYDPKVKPSTTYITFCSIARPVIKAQNPDMASPAILTVRQPHYICRR